jgi:hypothetical protein
MTDVQICNLALARLGDAKITTLGDATAQAQYCTLFFGQTVKELQTDLDWQFCRKLATATADNTPPAFGYANRFPLPADFLRVLRINGVDEDENFSKWEIIGGFIHTSLTGPIQLDYIANVTDTTTFPAVFVELLTAKLAAHLALPLTGSKELFAQMAQIYAESIQRPSVTSLVIAQAKDRSAATISNEEICRQAILRIGTAEQLGPSTQGMLLAQSLLPQVRDHLLLAGSWTWANKSTVLTADTLWPEFKWTYSYGLPSDCLRVYRVNDTGLREPEAAWEVQGGRLLTDAESEAPEWLTGRTYAVGNAVTHEAKVYRCLLAHTAGTFATDLAANRWVLWTGGVLCLEYIARETDPTKFDNGFVELLSATLAAKLAVPLAGDVDKARLLSAEAEALLKTSAMRRDSTERRLRIKPAWVDSKLIRARYA